MGQALFREQEEWLVKIIFFFSPLLLSLTWPSTLIWGLTIIIFTSLPSQIRRGGVSKIETCACGPQVQAATEGCHLQAQGEGCGFSHTSNTWGTEKRFLPTLNCKLPRKAAIYKHKVWGCECGDKEQYTWTIYMKDRYLFLYWLSFCLLLIPRCMKQRVPVTPFIIIDSLY